MPNEKQPDSFPIPLNLSDAIITYLSTRPYKEVSHLISALQQSYTMSQEKAPTPPKLPNKEGK